jgi:hyperosmotically inducible protein
MDLTWLRDQFALPNGQPGGNMKRAIFVALGTGAVISSAAALSIGAATVSDPQSINREEYEAALRSVADVREKVLARCEALAGFEREYCRAEQLADETVRVADLEASYRRTQQSARAAQRARIDARYQLDRARCQAQAGFKRDQCQIRAHTTRGRALLDAAAPYEVRRL